MVALTTPLAWFPSSQDILWERKIFSLKFLKDQLENGKVPNTSIYFWHGIWLDNLSRGGLPIGRQDFMLLFIDNCKL